MAKTTMVAPRKVGVRTRDEPRRNAANHSHVKKALNYEAAACAALMRDNATLQEKLFSAESELNALRVWTTIELTRVDKLQQQVCELQARLYDQRIEARPYTSQHMAEPTPWIDAMAGNGTH
jgi:hypothetical protein